MSQLSCVDSGNKSQNKGPWSLGDRNQRYVPEGKRRGKAQECSRESMCWGRKGVGKGAGNAQEIERQRQREREMAESFVLRGFIWRSQGEDLHRIFISLLGVSHQGPGVH